MSSFLLIFSTFFDGNSGAGSTQDYFELQLCSPQGLLDMVAGPGGRRLDDCPRESRLPSKLPASVSKTPKWILFFLYLSKVFYTRLELLLGCEYGSDKLGVPT